MDKDDNSADWPTTAAIEKHERDLRLSQEADFFWRRRQWNQARERHQAIAMSPAPDITALHGPYGADAGEEAALSLWYDEQRRWRAWHWARVGVICLHLKEKEKALAAFQQALREDSECPEAWGGVAVHSLKTFQWKQWRFCLTQIKTAANSVRAVATKRRRGRTEAVAKLSYRADELNRD